MRGVLRLSRSKRSLKAALIEVCRPVEASAHEGEPSMKLTRSMCRCLILLDRSGEALRVWSGKRGHEWSWRINDAPMTLQVDRCIHAGLLDVASQGRVILSLLGQRIVREV